MSAFPPYDGSDDAPRDPRSLTLEGVEREIASFAPTTNAIITGAVETAIRGVNLGARVRIRKLNVSPEYGFSDDERMVSAEVAVQFSLIFHGEAIR